MSYLVGIPALWVGLRRRKQQIKMFRWNSLCYGNIRHSIYPAAVFVYPKCSWKKRCLFMGFSIPSFQNTHIFHHFFWGTYRDTEINSLIPQTKQLQLQDWFKKENPCSERAVFWRWVSWWILIYFFLSVYTYKCIYVTFRQTLVTGRNNSCTFSQLQFRCLTKATSLPLWATKNEQLQKAIHSVSSHKMG